MGKEFKQKSLLVSKTFTIDEEGVQMRTKESDGESEMFIPYNLMGPRYKNRIYTERNNKIIQGAGILLALALVRVVMIADGDDTRLLITIGVAASIGLIGLAAWIILRTRYYLIELDNETQMFVILDKPDKAAFDQFIDEVYAARKVNYRQNYFRIDPDNKMEDEISRMKWLLSEKLITESEYEVIVDEIKVKFL